MGDYRVTNSFVASFRSFFIKSGEMSIKTNERNLRTNAAAARFRSGTVRSFVRIIENSLTRNPWSAWNNKNCVIYCLYTARVVSNWNIKSFKNIDQRYLCFASGSCQPSGRLFQNIVRLYMTSFYLCCTTGTIYHIRRQTPCVDIRTIVPVVRSRLLDFIIFFKLRHY